MPSLDSEARRTHRHCERSEAIQSREDWIATAFGLAMTN
jgi:hypothetical protein